MAVELDDASKGRIWDHRQALSSDFYQISNFFLVAQSFLLTSAVVVGTDSPPSHYLVRVLGLVVSIVWLYIQSKQKSILDALKTQCETIFPEYAATRASRSGVFVVSNTSLVAYAIPGVFSASWIVLLFF